MNSLNNFADEEDENNDSSNHPLLSSIKRKVKMGSFSIRYNPHQKSSAGRYDIDHNNSPYHDFTPNESANDDGEDDDFSLNRRANQTFLKRLLYKLKRYTSSSNNNSSFPLRILLLALYLAFTLSSFWILDSIKEPTLAILVNGDLGKHQPRAKMVSFVVVIALALCMEWLDQMRQQHNNMLYRQNNRERRDDDVVVVDRLNKELERSWENRNLPTSMMISSSLSLSPVGDNYIRTKWKSMKVQSSQFWHHFAWRRNAATAADENNDDDEGEQQSTSSSRITSIAFYIVGSFYIHAFVTVAVALKTHPSFRSHRSTLFHGVNQESVVVDNGGDENHVDWYFPTLGYVLFALVESFGSVSITIFWAFTNSNLTLETAERQYGSIVAVAQMGAIAGSTLSAVLGRRRSSPQIDEQQQPPHFILDEEGMVVVDMNVETEEGDAHVTPMLMFIACGCIGAGMVIMAVYTQLFSKPMQDVQIGANVRPNSRRNEEENEYVKETVFQKQDEPKSVSDLFEGVRMIFRHDYLKLVLAASVLYEIALTCMHYELNLIGLDRFGDGASTVDETEHSTNSAKNASDEDITYIQFMGWYGQTVNILSLFLSFYAFPRLIKKFGLRTTIRIFPTFLLFATTFAFVLFPRNLYFLFISLSICKALTYSIHTPSEEVLYMPTSDVAKFKAKFWIDAVGQRIAKAIGSAINNYAGSVERIIKYGSLPSIVTALILWLACYQVGILFDGLIENGDVVGLDDLGLECNELEMRKGVGDDASSDDCDLLRDPDEDVVLTKFGMTNRTEAGSEHVLI